MAPFDFWAQASIGSIFALGSREQLATTAHPFRTRTFLDLLVYSALAYSPSVIFFVAAWPSWYVMYAVDTEGPRRGLAWLEVVNLYIQYACLVLGYGVAAWRLRRNGGQPGRILAVNLICWAIVLFSCIVPYWDRTFVAAPFMEYHPIPRFEVRWGEAHSFWGGEILAFWCLWAVVDVGLFAWFYRRLRQRSASCAPEALPSLV